MSALQHAWFGELDTSALTTSDVIWERKFSLAGSTFEAWLWANPDVALDTVLLDTFATRLDNLPALDATARQGMREYLDGDRFYIEHHADYVEEIEVMAELIGDGDADAIPVEAFVAAMSLCGIGLWLEVADAPLVLDYMIDPEHSDQILAVKMSRDGQIVAIDWES